MFGIGFAKNILASLSDRFGRYPQFMLMRPHVLATITDPRYSWIYFDQREELANVRDDALDFLREEMRLIATEMDERPVQSTPNNANSNNESDSFWGDFDRRKTGPSQPLSDPIEKEIASWKGISPLPRTSNPLHAMAGLKMDFPLINKVFQKFAVLPAVVFLRFHVH